MIVIEKAVNKMAEAREVPPVSGSNRMEDQTVFGDAYVLGINLENTLWLSEGDKRRIKEFVSEAMQAIREARNPCRWWEFSCKKRLRTPLVEKQVD
ncbi:hypothetical protein DLP3_035 [Stenotrophomonas phage vB_SmaS_DLP_3]|nr:hypothetical protein DLP3_035 [Stenotrophomonas phage vB_SmaS_DLP_3]